MHHPPVGTSLAALAAGQNPAQRRLSFEELLAHQLSMQQLKQRIQSEPAPALQDPDKLSAPLRRVLAVYADCRASACTW